ncbi:hypothetical protein FIBSPDRAFT_867932 [Athelia psychrophila]|uniref:Uncharacterized protein n=1 Tax=Athelia psychrophila TaxID=1759441 RepID=A0A166DK03_9AGAM|nr:hypothetical protein FIBSPDRAFT_867932 [Fibularhizoctonia sp. CBS 109695]
MLGARKRVHFLLATHHTNQNGPHTFRDLDQISESGLACEIVTVMTIRERRGKRLTSRMIPMPNFSPLLEHIMRYAQEHPHIEPAIALTWSLSPQTRPSTSPPPLPSAAPSAR